MKIYSGYFSGIKKHDYPTPISITLSPPKWWTGPEASFLAPGKWLWHWKEKCASRSNAESIDDYMKLYMSTTLLGIHPNDVFERLFKISDGNDCTIVCYEKPEIGECIPQQLEVGKTFCHRHIVTAYLRFGGYESYEFS